MNPQWLTWAQQIQAIAQNGLAYCDNVYDIERYEQLQALAVEILATHTATDPVRLLDLFRAEAGYATPKVDVRGGFSGGEIAIGAGAIRRWLDPPGGWADVGDSPATAVVREIEEESGYQTRATKLVAVYDRDHPRHGHPPLAYHVYKPLFHCEIIGAHRKSIETSNGFFGADELPTLSLTRGAGAKLLDFLRIWLTRHCQLTLISASNPSLPNCLPSHCRLMNFCVLNSPEEFL
ncbi:MAG: NUDIX hydrolase N-terminal domain-containing protein [Caldilineaceae bacterium]